MDPSIIEPYFDASLSIMPMLPRPGRTDSGLVESNNTSRSSTNHSTARTSLASAISLDAQYDLKEYVQQPLSLPSPAIRRKASRQRRASPSQTTSSRNLSLVGSHRGRPVIPSRSTSKSYCGRRNECPCQLYQRSKQLFQSLEGSLADSCIDASFHPSHERVRTLTGPSFHDDDHSKPEAFKHPLLQSDLDDQPVTSAPIPNATIIDWTSPATRRHEYAKIDASRRGLRGLWRKITPQWCWKNSRMTFYDESSGSSEDGASVRRYRIELHDDDDDDEGTVGAKDEKGKDGVNDGVTVMEREIRPVLEKAHTFWNCFGAKRERLLYRRG